VALLILLSMAAFSLGALESPTLPASLELSRTLPDSVGPLPARPTRLELILRRYPGPPAFLPLMATSFTVHRTGGTVYPTECFTRRRHEC
jgi:hypothetical protein